mmetsp:Transcript_24108/g.71548  ORF Transcript_24108/g.71548 Transcript_24108/m.71548 type:complete len:215 (-) Transcript_24108:158-802(-)
MLQELNLQGFSDCLLCFTQASRHPGIASLVHTCTSTLALQLESGRETLSTLRQVMAFLLLFGILMAQDGFPHRHMHTDLWRWRGQCSRQQAVRVAPLRPAMLQADALVLRPASAATCGPPSSRCLADFLVRQTCGTHENPTCVPPWPSCPWPGIRPVFVTLFARPQQQHRVHCAHAAVPEPPRQLLRRVVQRPPRRRERRLHPRPRRRQLFAWL